MRVVEAYCGTPPVPGELWGRFNLDPVLIAALVLLSAAAWRWAPPERRTAALAGWGIAAAALLSPLCALSVTLFSARVAQHMLLALVAAPLIAAALPERVRPAGWWPFAAAGGFAAALWAWHLPGPYDATFRSDALYWTMHLTLFGTAVLLWRALLHRGQEQGFLALGLGAFTTVQMGLLGAILTFSTRPLFPVHAVTTLAWGMDPVTDQALGGLLMWVPGTAFFLVAAKRSLDRLLPATVTRPA
jgi:putative membrane protein